MLFRLVVLLERLNKSACFILNLVYYLKKNIDLFYV